MENSEGKYTRHVIVDTRTLGLPVRNKTNDILRLYFSIEPVVRARRLAAENQIEMCDDRDDCCSGIAFHFDRTETRHDLCDPSRRSVRSYLKKQSEMSIV